MIFQFLGTCAADFSQKLELELKDRFDKNVRRASCALIDGKYLIDCGPHMIDSFRISGNKMSDVEGIFLTHLHDDHFQISSIEAIVNEKNKRGKTKPLKIYVKEGADFPAIQGTEIIYLTPYRKYTVDDLTVYGLHANHDTDVFPQHFLFEKDGKSIFYGCDGGWMLTDTFYFLQRRKIDLMILDGTVGDYRGDYRMSTHNSIQMVQMMLTYFKNVEIVGEQSKVYISHLAPSLHKNHDQTTELLAKDGISVAYDGLKLEI